MTHDHKRNGTTRLFAALNTLDGTVVGRCMPRHTHKHPKVLEWLADQPRWAFHFTPTSASWINAVEGFFSAITRRRIRRGVSKSVADLQDAITRCIREHNKAAKPFA